MKKRIAPGLWVDDTDQIHVCVQELLQLVGLPDTEENRKSIIDLATRVLKEKYPTADILETFEKNPTYAVNTDGTTMECFTCGAFTASKEDIKRRYCHNCHTYHEGTAECTCPRLPA